MIVEESGNLLLDDAQALVNTVNTVGVMGKGLALQFKRAFPENFDAYALACAQGRVRVGEIFATSIDGDRWILNFPTKRHWRQPSRLDDVRSGLDALVRVIVEMDLQSVAVPPLGCGNGGLDWNVVRSLIIEKLGGLDAEIRLYGLGTPAPEEMPVRSARPPLNRDRARLLAALNRYAVTAHEAGVAVDTNTSLLEAQKVVYLLQGAGLDLGYRFERGHYGPFSNDLNRDISAMEGHYLIGYGDGTGGSRATLHMLPAVRRAEEHVADDAEFQSAWRRVARAAFGYEYPDGMELLSTVHFIAVRNDSAATPGAVAEEVARWSERKRRLFSVEDVLAAWEQLHRTSLLVSGH
ncbi:type II toxin-antitoxin system antitoxin DNA ADP-ribosyl glycohydrolase DarG [Actinomadura hibisca]|uniref:type II toxin-antitoxin system antitoxin DNA ADP-ribosyl glycohydrolase DarG n=1 Tax=Actinomadura hibisca TaxID=68565 RepID=UPI000835C4D5|nr:macro domain-containing protein [Actinomadura hibisca]